MPIDTSGETSEREAYSPARPNEAEYLEWEPSDSPVAVRMHLGELHLPLDIILHPRRSVLTLDFTLLEKEVRQIFRGVQSAAAKGALPAPQPAAKPGKRSRG